MTYAIAQVIYGVPLSDGDAMSEELGEILENEGCSESEQAGFHSFYSGGSPVTPAAFGVRLDEFDEACYSIDLDTLKLAPTNEQLALFNSAWASLEENVRKALEPMGEPRVFILWSTS